MSQKSLDGFYRESELPLLIKRRGMATWENDSVVILDRRKLPHSEEYLTCRTTEEVALAIESMAIQGAFSISIAAGYGLALSMLNNYSLLSIKEAGNRLISTRPTGLALSRVINLCLQKAEEAINHNKSPKDVVLDLTTKVASDLAKQARRTAQYAISLIPDGASILTHCFPDRSYVYLLLEAKRQNLNINFICSETRPYFQGTKLTSYCSSEMGFKTKVITDGMGGALIREKKIDIFMTAADRVCMDGTIANKIGTYQYALAANINDVPYYVLRQSGPDVESKSEDDIKIEVRSGEDLTKLNGLDHAPKNVEGYYPSFDITSAHLVSKIITDRGIFEPKKIYSYYDSDSFVKDSLI